MVVISFDHDLIHNEEVVEEITTPFDGCDRNICVKTPHDICSTPEDVSNIQEPPTHPSTASYSFASSKMMPSGASHPKSSSSRIASGAVDLDFIRVSGEVSAAVSSSFSHSSSHWHPISQLQHQTLQKCNEYRHDCCTTDYALEDLHKSATEMDQTEEISPPSLALPPSLRGHLPCRCRSFDRVEKDPTDIKTICDKPSQNLTKTLTQAVKEHLTGFWERHHLWEYPDTNESRLSKNSESKSARLNAVSRWSRLVCVSVCVLACLGYVQCKPINEAETRFRELQAHTVKYLAQFGYLRGPSRETQNLRSHEDLTMAIKALQKAGGIPQTGVPDSRTEALMLRPRCGNTDDFVEDVRKSEDDDGTLKIRKRRYTVATSKWPRTNLTFRFVNYTPDMPQAKTRELISDALRVWSDATPLSFTEVRDSNADIMVMFASQYHSDGYPFDGKGMVLGHAFFPGHGKGGDTHFDDDENWTTNSTDGVDLFMVAAHEFGHALGLAHSGDPSALMYPWYMGFEGKFQLPEDDFKGITSLYGSGEVDRRLPEKGKVSLIPNSNYPPSRETPYDIEPTKPVKDDKEEEGPPDPCSSHIDALTVIRTDLFLFIGKWFWRLDSRKLIVKPLEIHQFWYGLPKDLEKIDAVFERPDNKIVFFSGDRYWIFNANHPVSGFPMEGRPITEFNIPADVKKIDAAFVWGYNKRTYLVSGDMYWKMDENNTFVEYDYPRDMGTWKDVPVPLDAAFRDWSGKTFFFQGLDFWEFYDMRMRVREGYPKRISRHFLNCPTEAQRVEQRPEQRPEPGSARLAGGENKSPVSKYTFVVLILALCLSKINSEILSRGTF